jgi:glycosyltransferase involved in cell wall biosynthesis
VHRALSAEYAYFEIVLVDDASRDDTLQRLEPLLGELEGLRLIRLSRRMGGEIAVTAGLQTAIGDFVAVMHADYDSSAALMAALDRAREGVDFVQGTCDLTSTRWAPYRWMRRAFFYVCRRGLGLTLIESATTLRVMSRQAVNGLTRIRSRRRYFSLLAADVGLTHAVHPYALISRSGRQPQQPWWEAVHDALSLIVHSSMRPLRLLSAAALAGSFLILCYVTYVVIVYFVKDDVMPGWTTLSLQVSGLFFLMFIMLALFGEYLGRLIDETSERPLYFVRDERSSSVMVINPHRPNLEERGDTSAAGARQPRP